MLALDMNTADQQLHEPIPFFMHDLPRFGQLNPDRNTVSCLLQHGTLHVRCLQISQATTMLK
jgi:hypothetical protein